MHSHNIQKYTDQNPKPTIFFSQTNHLIMISVYGSACPRLWNSVRINSHQSQLCAVKPLQVRQECFPEHDIYIHQTENNSLHHPRKTDV